jgi:hypothetical protein
LRLFPKRFLLHFKVNKMAVPPGKQMDPLVAIVMDSKVIELSSTLVAKLEHVGFDETRRGVFKTTWGRGLFDTCLKRLKENCFFDIDDWYSKVVTQRPSVDTSIDPSLYVQTVDTNWLAPLFEVEMKTPGFILLLHNILDLEDKIHAKLAEQSKEETQYDFLGLGSRNKALRLTMSSATEKRKLLTQKK